MMTHMRVQSMSGGGMMIRVGSEQHLIQEGPRGRSEAQPGYLASQPGSPSARGGLLRLRSPVDAAREERPAPASPTPPATPSVAGASPRATSPILMSSASPSVTPPPASTFASALHETVAPSTAAAATTRAWWRRC